MSRIHDRHDRTGEVVVVAMFSIGLLVVGLVTGAAAPLAAGFVGLLFAHAALERVQSRERPSPSGPVVAELDDWAWPVREETA